MSPLASSVTMVGGTQRCEQSLPCDERRLVMRRILSMKGAIVSGFRGSNGVPTVLLV